MGRKKIMIDFYRVSTGNDLSFEDVLKVADTTTAEVRAIPLRGVPVRLESLHRTQTGQWLGHIAKIRLDSTVRKASIKKLGLQDISLQEDEGIAEETSFLYDEALRLLLFQRNYYGIRIDTFVDYMQVLFSRITDTRRRVAIDIAAITGGDTIAKLKSSGVIKQLAAKIAIPRNEASIQKFKRNKLLSTWIDNLQLSDSETLHVHLSLGRSGRRTLVREIITSAAEMAIEERDVVQMFRIRARESDEDRLEWIDLLEDRTYEYAELDVSRENPLTHQRMCQELIAAFDKRRAELEAYFQTGER